MQTNYLAGKKILFGNFPADGHFNPLTGLATYLTNMGADVRWYSSKSYSKKIASLGIHHYPYKRALEVSDGEFDKVFPERANIRSQLGKLKFDIVHAFIERGPEYYGDIKDIHREFKFDILIADCAFTGISFVKELMRIPVIAIGVLPLSTSSRDLPPGGLGMTPSYSFFGKIKQAVLRKVSDTIIFGKPNKILWKMYDEYKIPHNNESLFDMLTVKADYLLQSGAPGFEYKRSDMAKHIRFMGPLLPVSKYCAEQWYDERLSKFSRIVLVTQGTVEKDINKLLVPAIEAFKNTDTLLIVTTGGSRTQELKDKYSYNNIIIEDFIPFADIMPYADVYITNGGYGGVMLGIENGLPLVVAGVHEGKNEICARVGYFKLGIDLKTETPTPSQIKAAVEQVLSDTIYKSNVSKLADEFSKYNTEELIIKYTTALIRKSARKRYRAIQPLYVTTHS